MQMVGDRGFAGWRMVAIAFLAQSSAVVISTGAYGAVMPTLQQELGTSRAMASLALGVMLSSLGLMSPFVGTLLQRFSLRNAMTLGAVLNIAGYLMIAYATEIWQVLAVYGLVIGPRACLVGPLTASTLVSRWFDRDRGKALGIANAPIFQLITQPIAAILLINGGRELPFLVLAGIFVLLIPVLRMIIDHPEQIGQTARPKLPAEGAGTPPPSSDRPLLTTRNLLHDPRFWTLSIGMGVLTGAGAAFVTHAASVAIEKGIDLASAATLVSFFGIGTIVGAIAFGVLADKIGPLASLAVNTALQAVVWSALIMATSLPVLWVLSALVGFCMGAA